MKCNLCGSEEIYRNYMRTKSGIVYDKCNSCGLVFRDEMIKVEKYNEDSSYRDYMFRESSMYEDFEKKILQIKKFKKKGKLLDVGANYGILMKVAKDYGFEVSGIEPSKSCCDYGRDRYGFDIKNGIMTEPTEEKYDVIVLNHVLEHEADPKTLLKNIRESLVSEGVLYLSFPNFGCEKAQKEKETWGYLMPDGHNYQFTIHTIEKYLTECGFDVVWNPELTENLAIIATKAEQETGVIDYQRIEKDHVDIILPVHNELDFTKNFINKLYATADYPFQLIIIDDASTDGTADFLDECLMKYNEICVVSNETNKGFLLSVNEGLKLSQNDYVLITNNDLEFTGKGWLSTTVNTLKQNSDIGAVGIEMLHDKVDFLSMCYFMTRKSIIEKIGFLDERYCPAVFEDVDYSTRIQLEGYGIVAIQIPVIHINNNADQLGQTKLQLAEKNRNKFREKFKFIDRYHKIVLHVNNQLYVGGIEEVIKNLVKYKKNGYEIWAASPQDGRMSKELEDFCAKVFIGNFNRIFNLMNIIKFDIVHTHTSGLLTYPNALSNAIVPKPIRIETIHSPGLSNATPDRLDKLVAVSQDTMDRQTFGNTEFIPNGVDMDKIKISGTKSDVITIGKFCRIAKDKKVLDFIIACYRINKLVGDKYNLQFELVGEDATLSYKYKLLNLIKSLGMTNFKFGPETRDISFIDRWNIGLNPTTSEGYGLTNAEILAYGVPVVTYDSFANRELVINGLTGFLCEVDDINGLVSRTIKLIKDEKLRYAMGMQGRQLMAKYTAVDMSNSYYDLYERLING